MTELTDAEIEEALGGELFPTVEFDPSTPFEKQLVKVSENGLETFRPFSFENINKRVSVQAGRYSRCSFLICGAKQSYPFIGVSAHGFAIDNAITFEVLICSFEF